MKKEIGDVVRAYFNESIEEGRYIYFQQVRSAKELTIQNVEDVLEKVGFTEYSEPGEIEEGAMTRIDSQPILFLELPEERWLVVYSSEKRALRRRLEKISDKVGWILDVWIPSETVDRLYQEFSPEKESVNIERKWDPYYIYQRASDVPDNLQDYYAENIDKFVEQEIEFNLKTPKWMVNDALEEGVQEDLLEKSEIAKSRFTYEADESLVGDGGTVIETPQSGVTVRNSGEVVHRSGEPEATLDLLNQIEQDSGSVYQQFNEVVPHREYNKNDAGIYRITSFSPGKALKIVFEEKSYDEEASITLSNLLTVGQDDVEIHGVIKKRGSQRDDLWFLTESYTPFDEGKYKILYTSPQNGDNTDRAAVYIEPVTCTTSGLIYVYQKLKEKFDTRTSSEVVNSLPLEHLQVAERE